MNEKQMVILLVEDNPDHTELISRSFQGHPVANKIYHVDDGEAAMDYLRRRGEFADLKKSPRPDVILLDLRLPKMDGLEVLNEIKSDKELRRTPVVVLSTSNAEKDVVKAYDYHASSYLVKPVDFYKFDQLMNDLGYYWLAWNRTPNKLGELER